MLEKKPIYQFLLILAAVVLLHIRAYDAGFVTDFTGLWAKMQGKSILDALYSFGFPSLMPLLNVFYYGLYKLFGLSAFPWFFVFASFYALGLFYFFRLSLILLADFEVEKAKSIALVSLVAVMVSPYQVEALIWKVGLGHISSVMFFIMALYYGVRYLRAKQTLDWVKMSFLQVASLLCFEWGLVFPVMLILFTWCYARWGEDKRIIISSILVCLAYLFLTKLMIGKAVGHYNIAVEGFSMILDMWTTTIKYFVKHISFLHFAPYKTKALLYGLAHHPMAGLLAILFILRTVYRLLKSGTKQNRLMVTLLLCSFVAILLVSPLYFQQLHPSENDRYGSLLMPFIMLLLVTCFFRLPKRICYALLSLYLITSLIFQQQLVGYWKVSNELLESLVESFPQELSERTLMLNLPENYHGVFMLKDFSGKNPLVDHLAMYGRPIPNVDLVAQYKIPSAGQGFTATRQGKLIELNMTGWGSYWMKDGKGVSSYETETYNAVLKDKAMRVELLGEGVYSGVLFTDGEVWEYVEF